MNKWRSRQLKDSAKPVLDVGDDTDRELSRDADNIYAEASKHRAGVIQKDLAAKSRRRKPRG
jgi:hypothetical protein